MCKSWMCKSWMCGSRCVGVRCIGVGCMGVRHVGIDCRAWMMCSTKAICCSYGVSDVSVYVLSIFAGANLFFLIICIYMVFNSATCSIRRVGAFRCL